MTRSLPALLTLSLISSFALTACADPDISDPDQASGSESDSDSDSESDSDSDSESEGEDSNSLTVTIEASVGGSIELGDGARVDFAPGSLSADAEITFTRLGCGGAYESASFATCRYAVEGPQELLVENYTLSMPTRGELAASCATQQEVDGLTCVRGSESADGAVSASVNSFKQFASWSEEADQPLDACVETNFEPCGGDPVGNWKMTGSCGTLLQLTGSDDWGNDPYAGTCDPLDYYVGSPVSLDGSLELIEGGGYSVNQGHSIMRHELVTLDCLDSLEFTCIPDLCEVEGDVCNCLYLEVESYGMMGDEEWSQIDETTLGLGGSEYRYCIEGDTLTLEWGSAGPEEERWYTVYTRD